MTTKRVYNEQRTAVRGADGRFYTLPTKCFTITSRGDRWLEKHYHVDRHEDGGRQALSHVTIKEWSCDGDELEIETAFVGAKVEPSELERRFLAGEPLVTEAELEHHAQKEAAAAAEHDERLRRLGPINPFLEK